MRLVAYVGGANTAGELSVFSRSNISAAVPTVLFAGTLGVLIAVTVFGVARVFDQALESINLVPIRWGENHIDILADIALVVSLPMVVAFSLWFFKKARKIEDGLEGYTYNPPE